MSQSFRIAMVAACPFPWPRGTPTRVLRLAEALGQRGHEVHVVTYHLGGPVSGPFQVHRIREIASYRRTAPGPTPRKLFQLDPLLAARLTDVLRRFPIEVIHAHHFEGLVAGVWARRRHRRPVLYDAHTLLESELPSYTHRVLRPAIQAAGAFLDRMLPPLADEVATVSEAIRDQLVRTTRLPPDRVTVVPNGIEEERFANEAGASPPRAGQPRTLIFTGNLAPYQGIERLLRSFRRILDARRDVRLQIVTDASFAPYEPLAHALGLRDHIDLIPDSPEQTPRHIAAADVALNPRVICAGTPQKLLNYMAAGKPIVSFSGSAYTLEHERSAWLVPGDDDESFAAGALRCLDDGTLAQTLGREARRKAEGLRWERAAQTLEQIYGRMSRRDT